METENGRGQEATATAGSAHIGIPRAVAGSLPAAAEGTEGENGQAHHGVGPACPGRIPEGEWPRTAGEPEVTYRPIPSLPNYFAGDDGSIWSLFDGKPRKRKLTPLWIAPRQCRLYVSFRIAGKPIPLLVHRLVLEAFVGPCPEGMEGCHNNGNGLDNRLENLRWDTHQANMDDRRTHATTASILTPETVLRIVELRKAGLTMARIATEVGTGERNVWGVLSGRTFSHVTGIPKRIDKSRRRTPNATPYALPQRPSGTSNPAPEPPESQQFRVPDGSRG